MKARIVRIGNSKGVRIPKPLLEQTGLSDEVVIEAEGNRLVIRRARPPRAGWAQAARALRARNEDRLIDPPTATRFDDEDWKW